ncbi:MAG: hypothetical protein AAFR35_06315 [Pseudomonadota bacterium]
METAKVSEYAHALFAARGPKAEAHAAQKARDAENANDRTAAETWHAVRVAIRELRGTRQG